MRKRFVALVLVLVMCFSLVGCKDIIQHYGLKETGSATDSLENKESSSPTATDNHEAETSTPSATEKNDLLPTESEETETSKPTQTPSDGIESGKESSITPLLYKVTDKNGNVLWLFGSIHIGRENFYPLPDYVMDAYKSSDVLAVECDVIAAEDDMATMTNAMIKLIYTDGSTIKDHIPKDLYDEAVKILKENGLYFSMVDYYMPSFWSMFIDSLLYEKIDAKQELGIDMTLLKDAKKNGKIVSEIESVEFQYGMIADYSEALQTYLLEASIEKYSQADTTKEYMNDLLDMWASGDEKKLKEYLSAEDIEDPEEKALYDEYTYAMDTSRNAVMTGYAINALKSGKEVFVCVGAAHVVDEGGMVARLSALGYTVEQVK